MFFSRLTRESTSARQARSGVRSAASSGIKAVLEIVLGGSCGRPSTKREGNLPL